jgi:hypothetical protein
MESNLTGREILIMDFSTKIFIASNKSLFEEVQSSYSRTSSIEHSGLFTILNYEKILNAMCEYLDGYMKYKDSGDNQYSNKIDQSTVAFYNRMFNDPVQYRKEIAMSEFRDINTQYLRGTKELQDKMHELESLTDVEAERLLRITDNQYKKLSKVYKADMEIFMWKTCGKNIKNEIKVAYDDKSSPVIHMK